MEKDFLTILVIIVLVILAILIIYRISGFISKGSGRAQKSDGAPSKDRSFEQLYDDMEDPAIREQRMRGSEKAASLKKNKDAKPEETKEKKQQANQVYRELMEKSKADLRTFREKQTDVDLIEIKK